MTSTKKSTDIEKASFLAEKCASLSLAHIKKQTNPEDMKLLELYGKKLDECMTRIDFSQVTVEQMKKLEKQINTFLGTRQQLSEIIRAAEAAGPRFKDASTQTNVVLKLTWRQRSGNIFKSRGHVVLSHDEPGTSNNHLTFF
ncbi:unnamed protein product [Caenorhabditis sp. 36 PRJEB53466]|nr:unnamed protein product [Caenorhabditis sp. 36 PRJEB53466]